MVSKWAILTLRIERGLPGSRRLLLLVQFSAAVSIISAAGRDSWRGSDTWSLSWFCISHLTTKFSYPWAPVLVASAVSCHPALSLAFQEKMNFGLTALGLTLW